MYCGTIQCVVAERCWDQVCWAVESYAWESTRNRGAAQAAAANGAGWTSLAGMAGYQGFCQISGQVAQRTGV